MFMALPQIKIQLEFTYIDARFLIFVCHSVPYLLNSGSKPIRLFEIKIGPEKRTGLFTVSKYLARIGLILR